MKRNNRGYDAISFLVLLITIMMIALAGNILFVNNQMIVAKAEEQINQNENNMEESGENIFIHIINKSMSLLEISYKESGGEDTTALLKSYLQKAVDINYENPKSLIKAQIPMMNDVEGEIETSVEAGEETEDDDTSEIYIAEDFHDNGDDSTVIGDENNPYKGDIQVLNDDNQGDVDGDNSPQQSQDQGLASGIEIVSTPVPTTIKINHTKGEPLVFVYHTHGTESYKPESVGNYHSLNRKYTVRRVGDIFSENLQNNGHKVVHDDTVHDYPSFQGSYKRSLDTLNKNLKANDSLKVVFDIHRDGINDIDKLGTAEYEAIRNKSIVNINGEDVARFQIVLGGDNENLEELKQFAYYLKAVSDELYPGFSKPILLKKFKFNQYKSDYYALLEVGNNANTIEEAERTAKYLSEVINQALRKCVVTE